MLKLFSSVRSTTLLANEFLTFGRRFLAASAEGNKKISGYMHFISRKDKVENSKIEELRTEWRSMTKEQKLDYTKAAAKNDPNVKVPSTNLVQWKPATMYSVFLVDIAGDIFKGTQDINGIDDRWKALTELNKDKLQKTAEDLNASSDPLLSNDLSAKKSYSSGYQLFCSEHISGSVTMPLVARLWKALSIEEQQLYNSRADAISGRPPKEKTVAPILPFTLFRRQQLALGVSKEEISIKWKVLSKDEKFITEFVKDAVEKGIELKFRQVKSE